MKKANNLALVFPGQGSQKVGMLNALADKFPSVITTFSEALPNQFKFLYRCIKNYDANY